LDSSDMVVVRFPKNPLGSQYIIFTCIRIYA
jgi:hypothetical protein